MSSEVMPLSCSILRGGTSRGVFFMAEDLPAERSEIEPLLLDVFGSPDIRQINGLGGATSQTSKAAIIGRPSIEGADVDYTFAQVSVTDPLVDWGGNCGNISSAVGPYAINQGLVPATDPVTTVRIHNTNTAKIIVAHVPTAEGRAVIDGDFEVPGVPGSGSRILLEFEDPAGSVTGKLLPTGRRCDRVELEDGRSFEVSIVDAANPVVFLRAADLGLAGTELPLEIEARRDIMETVEAVRSVVAEWLGLVDDRREATRRSPGLPKIGFVAPPTAYRSTTGEDIPAEAADLTGRLMSMQTAHRSYMTTGAIATVVAASIPGTIPAEMVRPAEERKAPDTIRIAHPYGVMETVVGADLSADPPAFSGVAVGRTARHILDGTVYVRRRALTPA
jgi:methylitaconate Delta-isomerase